MNTLESRNKFKEGVEKIRRARVSATDAVRSVLVSTEHFQQFSRILEYLPSTKYSLVVELVIAAAKVDREKMTSMLTQIEEHTSRLVPIILTKDSNGRPIVDRSAANMPSAFFQKMREELGIHSPSEKDADT